MTETERAFILVLTSVGILAGFTEETTSLEKALLIIAPLLMWSFWRMIGRQIRGSRGLLRPRSKTD